MSVAASPAFVPATSRTRTDPFSASPLPSLVKSAHGL